MTPLYCGYDQREAIGFHVFVASVLKQCRGSVALTPLGAHGMTGGSNAFTRSRFLVPHLQGHKGFAIFADGSDMLLTADLAELVALADVSKAVQVVKSNYKTRHRIKYLGTEMCCPNMDYPRKNWASLMLINCAHPAWANVNPAYVAGAATKDLLQFCFLDDADIGDLPDRWNRLVDEGQEVEGAAILHWTAGIPGFEHYRNAPGASLWHETKRLMEYT